MISTWSPDKDRLSFSYAADAHRLQVVPRNAAFPYSMHVGMVAIANHACPYDRVPQ